MQANPIISHLIAAVGRGLGCSKYEYDGPSARFLPWAVSDVQLAHSSVFPGKFVIGIRIRGQPGAAPKIPVSSTPTITSRKKTNRLGSAATLAGAFGFRSRGKTISGEESKPVKQETPFDIYELTHGNHSPKGTPPCSARVASVPSPVHFSEFDDIYADRTLYLRFTTIEERMQYFTVFRSFCGLRTLDDPSTHRRLSLCIYDLIELSPDNSKRSPDHEQDTMTENRSRASRGDTYATTGYMGAESTSDKKWKLLKTGWTYKDKLAIEV